MWFTRFLIYAILVAMGAAHAALFARAAGLEPSFATAGVQIALLSAAWGLVLLVPRYITTLAQCAGRMMFAFAWSWQACGLYWLHFSMHDIGGLPTWLSVLAIAALSAYLAAYYAQRQFFRGCKRVYSKQNADN
jgi:apolipoprotein N-acyltransferase